MKTREKIVIGILALVLISNLIIIAVIALGEKKMSEAPKEEVKPAEWVEREDLPSSKNVALFDEKKTVKKVTYDTSRKLDDGQMVDVYLDEDGSKYHYEGERLVGIYKELYEEEESSQNIPTEKAIDIAKKYLLETYGENLEGYELDEIYGEGSSKLRIFFSKRYGKDGFVSGETIYVTMSRAGEVYSSALPYEKYLGFNEELLSGITKESIEAFVEEQLKEKYEKNLISFESDFISIDQIDGKYCLEIGVDVRISDVGGKEASCTETYRYALE